VTVYFTQYDRLPYIVLYTILHPLLYILRCTVVYFTLLEFHSLCPTCVSCILRTYVLTYLRVRAYSSFLYRALLHFIFATSCYLRTYLLTCLRTYLLPFLLTYLRVRAYLSFLYCASLYCTPLDLRTYLRTYLLPYLLAYLLIYVLTCLRVRACPCL